MKIYKSYLIICLFIGVALGNVLVVNATIPEDEDYYKWDYQWTKDYINKHESVAGWNTVRTANTGTSNSNGNSPPFRVWTSESRGKYFIDRSLCELDLTNVTNFYYVYSIRFTVYVSSFNDANNNAKLYITNGTGFSYGANTDYNYAKHYFVSPVAFRSPSAFGVIVSTGWYNITLVSDNGFNDYLRDNILNLSFVHEDDRSNNAPAVAGDNYIEFNVTSITTNLVTVAGFKSHGDGWGLISIPVNSTISNSDLYVRSDLNNYTWSNAVSNNVVQYCVYGYNTTSERYYLTSEMNGNIGYWIYLDPDYELWHTNFSVGGAVVCVHNEDDYLFISGLDLEPITVVLVLFGLFWWTANEKQDAGLMLLSSVILLGIAMYYISVFEILSSLFGVAILLVSLYGFALTIEFINSNNGKIRKK